MAILSDALAQQLRERFAESLPAPVDLTLRTRPGTGRLILPGGMGCETCEDAGRLAEAVAGLSDGKINLEVVDVTAGDGDRDADVPAFQIAPAGEEARVSFLGLPGGFEFGAFVDALERVSAGEHGLQERTVGLLQAVEDPVEVLVFSTPG